MPQRPGRLCAQPGCPSYAVLHGRCQQHMRQEWTRRERHRGSSTARGYDKDWRKVRLQALERDGYLCVVCQAQGKVTLAGEVDHVVPLARGGARLAIENMQALCEGCHAEKTATENRRY